MGRREELFLDGLRRALEMEEHMVAELVRLCKLQPGDASLPERTRRRIDAVLRTLQNDSERHFQVVAALMARYGGGHRGDGTESS